ncbi:hypothetical protein GCM10020331_091260 [Ectobacillus funiculus]
MRFEELPTPCYVVDEGLVEKSTDLKRSYKTYRMQNHLGTKKAFSMYKMYPLVAEYLHGTTASGLFEARLGYEEMGKENHVFAPAYRDDEIDEIAEICDHIIFLTPSHSWRNLRIKCCKLAKKVGLRINPECSTQDGHDIYDPCATGSRFGVTREQFRPELLEGVSGLHFHTLCQQNSDDLAKKTLEAVEEKFGEWLPQMEWINFGGGHHITREDYNIPLLEECIKKNAGEIRFRSVS